MKATILGIKSVDYVSKKTGQPVQGSELHYVRELSNREVEHSVGQAVGTVFVSAKSPLFARVSPAVIQRLCSVWAILCSRTSSSLIILLILPGYPL